MGNVFKKIKKKVFIFSFTAAFTYAFIMALFAFSDNDSFDIIRFLINLSVITCVNYIVFRNYFKKKDNYDQRL